MDVVFGRFSGTLLGYELTCSGATIGAAQLDSLFERAVLEKLEEADQLLPMDLEDLPQTAWEMRICKEYQNAKCSFGSEESYTEDTFGVRVPRLDKAYVNDPCGIRGGEMIFNRYSDMSAYSSNALLIEAQRRTEAVFRFPGICAIQSIDRCNLTTVRR